MENNYQFEERHIMKEGPDEGELRQMAPLAGGLDKLAATKGKTFKEMNPDLSNTQELLNLMAQEPKLLKRPLLWQDETLVVGFDEEKYRELLNNG